MKLRKAVYAASLDPITNGHVNVIERMAPLYDELVVVVAVDVRKNYTFTADERVAMARAAVAHLPGVSVDVCVGRYVVKHADAIGAQAIIRGLRNFKDLEAEQTLAEENRRICPHIETIWVPCVPSLMHVSSSMVKGHVGIDPGWEEQVARSVPAAVVDKLREKYDVARAHKHWARCMAALGNPPDAGEVLDDLIKRYGESSRAYHNLAHVLAMLDEREATGSAPKSTALTLAIWFHDAIYDPRAKDNEARSAELAKQLMARLKVAPEMAERVERLILATQHAAVPVDPEARLIADLDLAVLGRSEQEFGRYEQGTAREYAWAPRAEYVAGRTRILQGFLNRPSIYATREFHERYEAAARENLRRSIAQMSGV